MQVNSQSLSHSSPCLRMWQWACCTWFALFGNSQRVLHGRRATFLPSNTKWHKNCKRLCSSIKNAHFKELHILISQYNNSLRAPWERHAKNRTKI